jgi:hypothetical protein
MSEPLDIKTTLSWLEEGIKHTRASIRWQIAAQIVSGEAASGTWQRLVAFAVEHDDEALAALNKVRVELGGEPWPDPSEPPPARPDD